VKHIKKKQSNIGAYGFTLAEVMLSVVIVGVAIVALMMLFCAGTIANDYGNDLSTSIFLAEQLRSMTDQEAFGNLMSYDGNTYNGVDANGNPVAGLERFQQGLSVQPVNPADMTVYIGPDPEAAILTAAVSCGGTQITRISWLRIR